MKKTIFPLIITAFLLPISCVNSSTVKNNEVNIPADYQYKKITGKVELSNDGKNVYIVVNPDCRCRISYLVVGDNINLVKKYNGKTVTVEGYLKNKTPWSGEIIVERIIKVE